MALVCRPCGTSCYKRAGVLFFLLSFVSPPVGFSCDFLCSHHVGLITPRSAMPFQSIFHFGRSSAAGGDAAASAAAKEASLNMDKSNATAPVLKTKTLEESIESAARRAASTVSATTTAIASKVSGASSLTQAKKTESNKLSASDLLGQAPAASTSGNVTATTPTPGSSQRKNSIVSINSGPTYQEVTATYDAGNNSVAAAIARRRSINFYDPMAEMIPGTSLKHLFCSLYSRPFVLSFDPCPATHHS